MAVNIFTSKEIKGSDLSKFLKSWQAFNLFLQMFKEICRVTLGKDIPFLTFRADTTTSSHWEKICSYIFFFFFSMREFCILEMDKEVGSACKF